MDTESDIQRRNGLPVDIMETLEPQFKSRKLSIEIEVRIFNAYVRSVILYNCEVDSFHMRLLRKMIGVEWPKQMKALNYIRK